MILPEKEEEERAPVMAEQPSSSGAAPAPGEASHTVPPSREDTSNEGQPALSEPSSIQKSAWGDKKGSIALFLLITGVLGGLVGAALVFALIMGGLVTLPQNQTTQEAVAELQTRTAALQERIAALKEPSPAGLDPAVTERLNALENQTETLMQRLTVVQTGQESLETLNQRLGMLEADAESRGDELSELKADLLQLQERLGNVQHRSEDTGLAIAVPLLSTKLAMGEPFSAELVALKARLPDLDSLAVLAPFADKGLPTRMSILQSFPARAMIAARPAAVGREDSESVADWLAESAKALFNYRESGENIGDPLSARLAVIEEALQKGDLTAAATAAEALPDYARAAATPWIVTLNQRIAAEKAVSALIDHLLAPTSAPANGG